MFSPIYDIWFLTISCINHVITMWCYIHVYWLDLDHIHKMSISSRVRVIVVEWPKLVVRPSAQNFLGVLATNYFRHSPVQVAVVTMCCHSCLHHVLISSRWPCSRHTIPTLCCIVLVVTLWCYIYSYLFYLDHVHIGPSSCFNFKPSRRLLAL